MKQGILAIKSNKALLRLSIPMLISTVVFVPLGTLLPLMVRNYFFKTAWQNGLIQTLFSSGMLIAAIVIGFTGGLKKQFLMISLFTGLLGLSSFIAGLIPANLFWVFCKLVFLMGSTGAGFNIPFTAYIQETVPPENLRKVLSLITIVMSFGAPVGMFIAGPIARYHWSQQLDDNRWDLDDRRVLFIYKFHPQSCSIFFLPDNGSNRDSRPNNVKKAQNTCLSKKQPAVTYAGCFSI